MKSSLVVSPEVRRPSVRNMIKGVKLSLFLVSFTASRSATLMLIPPDGSSVYIVLWSDIVYFLCPKISAAFLLRR